MWIKVILLVAYCSYACGVPALPKVMQMMLGNDGNITNRRYAILNTYTATGTKNVRWETMPTNLMDENGWFNWIVVLLIYAHERCAMNRH